MPVYYFNVPNDRDELDQVGTELPDLHEARVAAIKNTAEKLALESENFWNKSEWEMTVTDEVGLTLFIITVLATNSPIVMRSDRRPA